MDNTSAGSLMVDHLPPAFQHLRRRRFEQLLLAGEVVAKRPNPTSAASMISWMLALSPPLGDQPHRGADQRLPRPRLCAGPAGSPPAPCGRSPAGGGFSLPAPTMRTTPGSSPARSGGRRRRTRRFALGTLRSTRCSRASDAGPPPVLPAPRHWSGRVVL